MSTQQPIGRVLAQAIVAQNEKLDAIYNLLVEQRDNDAVPMNGSLLSAGEVALKLGKTRDWVYDHQAELGALKLTDGPRPRLGFDYAEVKRRMEARSEGTITTDQEPKPQKPRRRAPANGVKLLDVKERAARSGG